MSNSIEQKNKDLETFLPTEKIVKIIDKDTKTEETFVIEELVIGNRAAFVKTFVSIFREVAQKRPDIKNKNNLEAVSALIEVSEGKLTEIYGLILKRDAAWITRNLTFKKEVEVLIAFFEVNDIPFLISQVQKYLPKEEN